MQNLVGYARVSTEDQNLEMQIRDLEIHGCKKIFTDKKSGASTERDGLEKCLRSLVAGDCLVVWRLDRLGRSMHHLVATINDLKSRGIGFRSLRDGGIDTTTASGELIFNIFASLAQFERSLIQERTKAGLSAARARGRIGGRPKLKSIDPKVRMAKSLHKDRKHSIGEICSTLGISKATLYRYLQL